MKDLGLPQKLHPVTFFMVSFFAFWVILHAFLSSADFFQNQHFQKMLSGISSECQIFCLA